MDPYKTRSPEELLCGNRYPGRGIVLGTTPDGTRALAAYFIMGRSENSRNRVFAERGGDVFTEPFDPAKVRDPSLIIYAAIRKSGAHLIVTNGDQTDTVCEGLAKGLTFEQSLESRTFEPDAPNFTPRISGLLTFAGGSFDCRMSILKSADAQGSACCRETFFCPSLPGVGYFLHTYVCDGDPLPSFRGEPERMALCDSIDEMTQRLWDALDPDNRISLYVRTVSLADGTAENRMINRNRRS